jgi:hypothetical protein
MQLGAGELAGSIKGHKKIELGLFGAHLGDINMEVADGILLELLLCWFISLDIGQATDAIWWSGGCRDSRPTATASICGRRYHRFLLLCQDGGARLSPIRASSTDVLFLHLATVFGLIPYCPARRFKLA